MRPMPLLLAAAIFAAPAAAAAEEWVTKETTKSVPDTVAALTSAIEGAGAKVMATVDHQANAASADLELPPTTVVIFGNPKIGTPLMQENRRAAIDLPQKILVWEEGGKTMVGYVAPAALADRYDLDADSQSIQTMVKALDKLSGAAVAE